MADRRQTFRGFLASLKRFRRNDQLVLSVLAVAIGVASGAAAIGFRSAVDVLQLVTYGFSGEQVATLAAALPWWQLLLAPTLGGLLIGLLIHHVMPDRRPQGVAQVIEASALGGGLMSLTTGLKAAAISAGSIAVGASVGREGPVVHLGHRRCRRTISRERETDRTRSPAARDRRRPERRRR